MKYVLLLLFFTPIIGRAQDDGNWIHLDPKDDNVLGISTYKAYEYLRDKTPDTVIVAILDNGAMIDHEDLKDNIWINTNEIPDNGIDDDSNGYVDDIHGWNFLGNSEGKNLKMETVEITRIYARFLDMYKDYDDIESVINNPNELRLYKQVKEDYEAKVKEKKEDIDLYQGVLSNYIKADKILQSKLKDENYTKEDIEKIKRAKGEVLWAKEIMLKIYAYSLDKEKIENHIKNSQKELDTRLNLDYDNRKQIVGDNPDDLSDTQYGNRIVNARGPSHGTGVSSLVGASFNELGYTGVARHVKLMILRVVPNGDERDKDIALAIRYAVNNGAQIINCSFGKKYSSHPEFVALAIEEAEKAGVLIINSSGNDANDNDDMPYYPVNQKPNGEAANNYLTVGASTHLDNESLIAFFSNYGQQSVDVLAPGHQVGNSQLNNKYGLSSGTSDAAPIVSGLAATLLAYYPYLTASQLREIIIRSVYIPDTKKVKTPSYEKDPKKAALNTLCASGGIVNLYQAILLIEKEYPKPN